MIVDYLHPMWTVFSPDEADPPLLVDANAVLASSVSAKSLQLVSRDRSQVAQDFRLVEQSELAFRLPAKGTELFDALAGEKAFGKRIAE
jgi:hypothetical protein